jgi:hypothetical protein
MRALVVTIAMSIAACGGGTTNAPTGNSTVGTGETGDPGVAGTECCCELPSDPETYELHDENLCHTDMHGVCVDAAMC